MEGSRQDMAISHSPQERANPSSISVLSPSKESKDKGPMPMSFPSILRNSGLTSRYAHLVDPVQPKKLWRRNDNEGKRWVRRRENAHFTGNPHVAIPSKNDLEPSVPIPHPTFPIPLPPYLPRSAPLSATVSPTPDPKASNAGQFSLSKRGMRKALRRSGPRTQALVRGVEEELMCWLSGVEVVMNPDKESGYQFPGRAVAGLEDIREVERSPQRLVWWIENDTWARYVVHCCARYHNIVSFSKDTPTHRLTHILRPNATRPDPATRTALATPPTTDGDFSSHSPYDSDALPSSLSDVQSIDSGLDVLSESDYASEPDFGSTHGRGAEGGQRHRPVEIAPLSDIASDVDADVEVGSVQGVGGGGDGDGSGGGHFNLEQATGALSLASDDETPRRLPLRGTAYRAWGAMWDAHQRARSGSSPSRSPARRKPRWPLERTMVKSSVSNNGGKTENFYDFLFK
ncbi:hypothetical protein F5888DRAFT_1684047 [Russula emetica]|nr:hypothetical protein F5888DRAFT_1684047 [Russula emetica]